MYVCYMSDSTISLTPNLYAGLYSITAPPTRTNLSYGLPWVFSAFLTDGRGMAGGLVFPSLVYQGISVCRRSGVHTRKPYRVPAVTRLSSLCEAKPCLISELRFGCVTQPNLYFFYAHGATRKLRTLEPDRRSQPWYVISTGQSLLACLKLQRYPYE